MFAAWAEKDMLIAYDLMGDSVTAGATIWPFVFLRRHINATYIKDTKRKQVAQYEDMLKPLWSDTRYTRIQIVADDFGELRGYPICMTLASADYLISKLREKGMFIRSELEGSPWTQIRKVIYLPLGPHLNSEDIQEVCNELLLLKNV